MSEHPGFTSPRLCDMRRVLDEVPLSARDHRAAEKALADIEAEWQGKHRDAYTAGVDARDNQHDEVLTVTEQFRELIAETIDDVRNGRRSPKEVRSWLRDVHADHGRLADQHRGIEATEDRLSEYEAMSPDDYQAQVFERHPLLVQGATTLRGKAQDNASRVQPASGAGMSDDDQDALIRELGGRPGPRRPAGW